MNAEYYLNFFLNIVLLYVLDFHAVCFDMSGKLIELCTVLCRVRTSIVMVTGLVYEVVCHPF